MRKSTLLKLMGTCAAVMFSFGVMAQYPTPIKHTVDNYNYTSVNETIYQTTGLGLTLYVAPDPVYSPSYDGTGARGTNLGTQSQWQWVFSATSFDDGVTAGDIVKAWANENWVELASTDLPAFNNSRTFWVKERLGAAGCASSTEQSRTVAVVDEPRITAFAGQNTGSVWQQVTAGTEYRYCGEGVRDNIAITLTETGLTDAALQAYTYGISVAMTAYDGSLVQIATSDATATYGQTANLASMIATQSHTFNMNTTNLNMYTVGAAKYITKYVFSLTANSLTSRISRVSNERASGANSPYNNLVATTVTYWLYPTPTTGPIYHIPNAYAF